MPQQSPLPDREDLLRVLQLVVLDRQTHYIKTPDGTAVMLPLQDYIRLSYGRRTLEEVIVRAHRRDLVGLCQVLDDFSLWLINGGGEEYVEYPNEGGGNDGGGTL